MMSSTGQNFRNACFCNPWSSSKPVISSSGISGGYTDADLAADMNSLTFAERQAMEEDIHGVADVIEETPEFVSSKIEEMKQALANLNSQQRQAWDRAVFLRPALALDGLFHLIFLRARRFQASEAASLMAAYLRAKRDLWGDDLLIQRITWDDLTEEEQAIFRTGSHRIIPSGDRTGRGVAVVKLSEYVIDDNFKALARRAWYVNAAVEDDPVMQQKGVVTVPNFSGQWKSSPFQLLRLMATFPFHAQPFHEVSKHFIYSDTSRHELIQAQIKFFRQRVRTRIRVHFGSSLETEYILRTFGIDISNLFGRNDMELRKSVEAEIRHRRQLDDAWRRSEAPFRDPLSPIALFPNPQDIIMGRNKAVAVTWPGNVMYHKLIQQYVHRYIEAQTTDSDWIDKTLVSVEILQVLHDRYKSRFLNRESTQWVVIKDSDAHTKISQALRNLSRDIAAQKR